MKRVLPGLLALGVIAATLVLTGVAAGGKGRVSVVRDAASGRLRPAEITREVRENGRTATVKQTLPFISSGTLAAAVSAQDERQTAADAAGGASVTPADVGITPGTIGCSQRGTGSQRDNRGPAGRGGSANVRVNQDCTYRRQAEEIIKYNPTDPNNLLAGQNDSRVGFNQCGYDYSVDNGQHWGDGLPPFRQRLNDPATQEPGNGDPNRNTLQGGPGTQHTYDAGSDPAVTFDSRGRGFFSCVGFDINSNASLVYVTQSPRGAQGSFFFNVSSAGRPFIVAEDNSPFVFHDKEFIVADTYTQSPNRDNVYVTWTAFKFSDACVTTDNPSGQCASPIFGSMSTDHGVTWSTPAEISGSAPALCSNGNQFDKGLGASDCNMDQGSDPVVLPNGKLVVTFNNGNPGPSTPGAQQLAVRCSPTGSSTNGTAHLNCQPPTRVGNDVTQGEPLCDFGRGPEECVPGPYIRTSDFPRAAVSPSSGHLYVTWQDYRNGEYDVQLAQSNDGGVTWTTAKTSVNPDYGLDHYFPAIDIAKTDRGGQSANGGQGSQGDQGQNGTQGSQGDRVGVSYYRSDRVPGENTTPATGFAPDGSNGVQQGNSDYVLAGGTALDTPYAFSVLSPVFPPPDGAQAGFNGDYSGLTINRGEEAHPIWSDTRNADPYSPANGVVRDEDVFTQTLTLPNGRGRTGRGQLGGQ